MGFLSQKIERSQVVAGDHVYTWRTAFTYSHHGIYIGDNRVVHFVGTETSGSFSSNGSILRCSSSLTSKISDPSVCPEFHDCGFRQPKSGVMLSCLGCFLAGGSLYRYEYGVPTHHVLFKLRGCTCTTAKSDPPEVVNHRASYLLQHGFLDYNMLSNNCEHFAMYCKTGLLCIDGGLIGQASALNTPIYATRTCAFLKFYDMYRKTGLLCIDGGWIGQGSALKTPIFATGTCAFLKRLIPGALIVSTSAAVMTLLTSRYTDDLGVRADYRGSGKPLVIKVPVEDLSSFCASGISARYDFWTDETSDDTLVTTQVSATVKKTSRHPVVKWAQRLDKLYINVLLSDAKHVRVNLKPDGGFVFSTITGVENHLYVQDLRLWGTVNLKGSKINIDKRGISCVIMKAEKKWWKKLLCGDETPHYVQVDRDKRVDEEGDDLGNEDEEMANSEEQDSAKAGGEAKGEEQELRKVVRFLQREA
ncbi:hypothetical protein Vadar_015437 [Vaccinium darrowii]|uniref:Uncharacterized protein n=1 Tax=Vaccinium darrowii TaxID=229202 RepID=A0ACB7ZBQ6_9ERIC|nr:hypothetical protein Vadar_015437 [Vaccinium darrowii]